MSICAWNTFLLLLVKEIHEIPFVSPQIVISLLTIPKVHGFVSLSLERSLGLGASTEVLRSQYTLLRVVLWLIMRLGSIRAMEVSVTNILRELLIGWIAQHRFRCTVKLWTSRSIFQLSLSLPALMMNLPEYVNYMTGLATFSSYGSNTGQGRSLLKFSARKCGDRLHLHPAAGILGAVRYCSTNSLCRTLEMRAGSDNWCPWDILIPQHSRYGLFN